MGTGSSSEPCVYERLWESIAVLRESGHRYGMSERDIERFICQVLQTNEPRGRPQPAFPLLRATAKCALALCVLLILGLGLSQPQSQSGAHSLGLNWSSPLGPVRLLDLPIAHKYNLQGYRGWWGHSPSPQHQSVLNCSVCADGVTVKTLALASSPGASLRPSTQPTIIKGGESWRIQRQRLEQLYESHSESVSLRLNQDEFGHNTGVPQGPANFTLRWSLTDCSSLKLLRWLFPGAELPLVDSSGSVLQRCVVSHLRNSQVHRRGVQVQEWLVLGSGQASVTVSPLHVCSHHCPPFTLQLTPGDMVWSDPSLWHMEFFPGPDQTIFCDGSMF